MTTNRSSEELAMRDAIEAWGRERWPTARCVHELVIGECRIDMAFISRDHIVGVEIKSSKDTLDRLDKQMDVFRRRLPEVWLAIAPKWADATGLGLNIMTVDPEAPPGSRVRGGNHAWTQIDRSVTSSLLWMLWRDELAAIASRLRLDHGKRSPIHYLLPLLARRLTGDEIVAEACRELRARRAFWKADPPIDDVPVADARKVVAEAIL